jgi:hypothetical protein
MLLLTHPSTGGNTHYGSISPAVILPGFITPCKTGGRCNPGMSPWRWRTPTSDDGALLEQVCDYTALCDG